MPSTHGTHPWVSRFSPPHWSQCTEHDRPTAPRPPTGDKRGCSLPARVREGARVAAQGGGDRPHPPLLDDDRSDPLRRHGPRAPRAAFHAPRGRSRPSASTASPAGRPCDGERRARGRDGRGAMRAAAGGTPAPNSRWHRPLPPRARPRARAPDRVQVVRWRPSQRRHRLGVRPFLQRQHLQPHQRPGARAPRIQARRPCRVSVRFRGRSIGCKDSLFRYSLDGQSMSCVRMFSGAFHWL